MDYGTEVKLVTSTPNSEETIEYAGRLCYGAEGKVGTKKGWIQDRIKDGHESILEHASATFYIKASRVLTHELVRHRIASYSQRSQRYVNESEPQFITPPEMADMDKQPETEGFYSSLMSDCWDTYTACLSRGIPKQIARYVLPNACQTEIVVTMNFRELRHFLKLRTSSKALPEMREVANKIKDICRELAPQIFGETMID